jgi:hypothetical protein
MFVAVPSAVERLAAKLEQFRGTGKSVDIGEMFRHLTLQVSPS